MTLKVVIADDEALSIDMLRVLLSETDPGVAAIDIVATCRTGDATLRAIRQHRPDLVFLDINMPEGDGLSVAEHLFQASAPAPDIIFTTAHAEFAARAFDLKALDYLLKPLTAGRLSQALSRLRDAGSLAVTPQEAIRIAVPVLGGIDFIQASQIEWVEASGDYVTLHTGSRSFIIRQTLTSLARETGTVLRQTHRSYLINPACVTKLMPKPKGEAILQVRSGAQIPVSRRHRAILSELRPGSPASPGS